MVLANPLDLTDNALDILGVKILAIEDNSDEDVPVMVSDSEDDATTDDEAEDIDEEELSQRFWASRTLLDFDLWL